jgi:hypothetical protein
MVAQALVLRTPNAHNKLAGAPELGFGLKVAGLFSFGRERAPSRSLVGNRNAEATRAHSFPPGPGGLDSEMMYP